MTTPPYLSTFFFPCPVFRLCLAQPCRRKCKHSPLFASSVYSILLFYHPGSQSLPNPMQGSASITRSTGTDRSSRSSSLAGCPLACDPSCASALWTSWGNTPGRWCTGRARHRCGCADVWSWPSSPSSAGDTACTRKASHLQRGICETWSDCPRTDCCQTYKVWPKTKIKPRVKNTPQSVVEPNVICWIKKSKCTRMKMRPHCVKV